MLEERIDDKPFLRLIRKWLRAGILETDGQVVHPVTGTPQGGIVSPVLANIYLHYALDLWFARRIKPRCQGEAMIIRFADDFVCTFQYRLMPSPFIVISVSGWASLGSRWPRIRLASSASAGLI